MRTQIPNIGGSCLGSERKEVFHSKPSSHPSQRLGPALVTHKEDFWERSDLPRSKRARKVPSVSVSLALERRPITEDSESVLFPSQGQLASVLVPQNSVTRSAPINSDSQGRCGTRFLTTYDRRFVIKTVSSEDVAEMHNILKKYHQVR